MSDDLFGTVSSSGSSSSSSMSSGRKDIDAWMKMKPKLQGAVIMVAGSNETGKSGLVMSYPLSKDGKMVFIDADGNAGPVAKVFHEKEVEQGKIIFKPPVVMDQESWQFDYKESIAYIRASMDWVRRNYEKEHIELFVIDGISRVLKLAEYMQRIETGKDYDEKFGQFFWGIRNREFGELLEFAKSLPVDVVLIAHDDFILGDTKLSYAHNRANQIVFQRIICEKEEALGKITYKARIDKSKYKPTLEGKVYIIDVRENGKQNWNPMPLWKELLGK